MVQETEVTATSSTETTMETTKTEPEAGQASTTVSSEDQVEVGSSAADADAGDIEDSMKKALNALVQGKRHYLMKDTPLACAALGDACRILADIYGPLGASSEHSEAHFFYGKALLDQARLDLAVFDAPAAGVDAKSGDEDTEESGDEENDEEEEEEDNEGEKKGEENEASKMDVGEGEGSTSGSGKNKDEKKEDAEEEGKEVTLSEEDINVPSPTVNGHGSSAPGLPLDDEQPSTSKGVVEGEENPEEDTSNLELAWEVLEIAKLGYMKQITSSEVALKAAQPEGRAAIEKSLLDLRSRLAETHSLLGEVGTESESYPQAIEDFKTALAMYVLFEPEDSREIAQVHFHMGIAHSLSKNYQESVSSLRQSAEILRKRMENLKKEVLENKAKANGQNGVGSDGSPLEKEILELAELLPEIEEKINDTLEQERDAEKSAEETRMEDEIMQRNSPVKNPNPPVANDISHLVKKRKKIEPEESSGAGGTGLIAESSTEPPSKKACTNLSFESASASSNGHGNSKNDDAVVPAVSVTADSTK